MILNTARFLKIFLPPITFLSYVVDEAGILVIPVKRGIKSQSVSALSCPLLLESVGIAF